jgi:hypothetical protein
MRVEHVNVRVAAAGLGEEDVVVDLEADLGREGEEGEGSFGRLGSRSEVKARHIGSVGLGSIAWLGELWSMEV